MKYLDAPHLAEILENRDATLSSLSVSEKFVESLNKKEWSNSMSMVDLELPHVKVSLSKTSESEMIKLIKNTTCIGLDEKIIFLFNESIPCLVCDIDFALENIDTIYWGAPGARYMCGANIVDGKVNANFNHLLIFDGVENLIVEG